MRVDPAALVMAGTSRVSRHLGLPSLGGGWAGTLALQGRETAPRAPGPSIRSTTLQQSLLARANAALVSAISQANAQVESGGRSRFSTLRTTAGESASFGVGQLTVREHLRAARSLTDAELSACGVRRTELDEMARRGAAAERWYRQAQVRGWRSTPGDERSLAQASGLPAGSLSTMGLTRQLADPILRMSFRALHREIQGNAFDPAHRSPTEMAHTARVLVERHPELSSLVEALGGDRRAFSSLAHYLGVGDRAENLHGWYARAARAAVGRHRFVTILQGLSPLTTAHRHRRNVARAIQAVAKATDLRRADRPLLVARIARCFHGAPSRARVAFFQQDGSARLRTAAELEATVDGLMAHRAWSDDRLRAAFIQLAAREGGRA